MRKWRIREQTRSLRVRQHGPKKPSVKNAKKREETHGPVSGQPVSHMSNSPWPACVAQAGEYYHSYVCHAVHVHTPPTARQCPSTSTGTGCAARQATRCSPVGTGHQPGSPGSPSPCWRCLPRQHTNHATLSCRCRCRWRRRRERQFAGVHVLGGVLVWACGHGCAWARTIETRRITHPAAQRRTQFSGIVTTYLVGGSGPRSGTAAAAN